VPHEAEARVRFVVEIAQLVMSFELFWIQSCHINFILNEIFLKSYDARLNEIQHICLSKSTVY